MTTLTLNTPPSIWGNLFKAFFLPRPNRAELPPLNGVIPECLVTANNLTAFNQVCQLADNTPCIVYPHVLASSMHMALLVHKEFPLKLLGAVHLRNQITGHHPINVNDSLKIESGFTDIRVTDKGVEFDFFTKCFRKDQLVWEELTTYFKRGRFGQATHNSLPTMATLTNYKEIASWHLANNLGKTYAKICNDYNPIHTSKFLAKLFGLKRDVAHGMGVFATALKHVEQKAALKNDIFFKGPLYLDNAVHLVQGTTETNRYDLYCGKNEKPSLCFKVF